MKTYAKEGQRQRRGKTKSKKRMLFGARKARPCRYCGKELTFATATVDHVIPLSKGGYDRLRNCVLACRRCNTAKGSKFDATVASKLWEPKSLCPEAAHA